MPELYSMRFGKFEKGLRDLNNNEVSINDVLVEIGSYVGESTLIFAMRAKTVYAIDPWDKLEDENLLIKGHAETDEMGSDMKLVESEFDKRTQHITNINKIKAFDYEVVDKFKDESIDFLYIDSIHTKEEVSRIIKLWYPKMKKTGKMAGHDYVDYFPGVKEAVNEAFSPIRTYIDNSWVAEVSCYLNK